MANPLPSPPSPPPPDPKPSTPTAGISPNKRKISGGDDDNARSKRKEVLEEEEVQLDDLEVMEGLLEYRSQNGLFPFHHPIHMDRFLRAWVFMGIGNYKEWKTKFIKMKTKFTDESVPVDDEERKEFEVWKQIWGKYNLDVLDKYRGGGGGGSSAAS